MRGHVRRRGKNSWAIVLEIGRDAVGKRQQKWHSVKGSREDADIELAKLLNKLHTGSYVRTSRLTVREYLKRWLADYAKANVSNKTFERYDEIVRIHLVPSLGHHRLSALQPLHIQSCYSEAMLNGRKDRKEGGLSAQTVLHHHRLLREALQQAVRWQLLARNPADSVEPPRPIRREMAVLTEGQTVELLKSLEATRLYVPVLLAVTTGLRRGEILALKWEDLDFDRATLTVRRSLERTNHGVHLKEPKTRKGRRVVALPQMTIHALRRHKAEQAKERLALGPAYRDSGFVCARICGTPMDPSELTAGFAAHIREQDLPTIRFHDLRHGHATHLLRQGVHPKVVSERLGHSTIGITLDVYSHVMPDMQKEAALRIESALSKAGGES